MEKMTNWIKRMTDWIKSAERGQSWYVAYPMIQAQITGVAAAAFSKNYIVTLHYLDGTSESAKLTAKELNSFNPSDIELLRLVSFVQSKRKGP